MHNNNIHSQTPGGTSETKKNKNKNKGGDTESRDMDTTSGWLM